MADQTKTTINALITDVWNPMIPKLIPEYSIFFDRVKFDSSDKLGNDFRAPLPLSREQGFTYTTGGGSISLRTAVPALYKEAKVTGAEISGQTRITMGAVTSLSGGSEVYAPDGTDLQLENLLMSHTFRQELDCIYGGTYLASIDSSANVSATTTTLTVNQDFWAAGIWVGNEIPVADNAGGGMRLDVFQATTDAAPLNTVGDVGLIAVDESVRALTVVAAAADITAIDAGTFPKYVYLRGVKTGASTFVQQTGIFTAMNAANSTTQYNVAKSYSLWANRKASFGNAAPSFELLNLATAKLVPVAVNKTVTYLMGPTAWANICNDQAALKRYTENGQTEYKNGAKRLAFTSQTGSLEIVVHPMIFDGYIMGLTFDTWKRVGASDITLVHPNTKQPMIQMTEAGMETIVKSYSFQAVLPTALGKNILVSGVRPVGTGLTLA